MGKLFKCPHLAAGEFTSARVDTGGNRDTFKVWGRVALVEQPTWGHIGIRHTAGWGASDTAGGLKETDPVWTGARQADSTWTIYVWGAEGGGRAHGDTAASSHGDGGSGFLAEESVLPQSYLGRDFYTYLFQGTWPLPSAASLLMFAQPHTNNTVSSCISHGTRTPEVLFGCVASFKLASCYSFKMVSVSFSFYSIY